MPSRPRSPIFVGASSLGSPRSFAGKAGGASPSKKGGGRVQKYACLDGSKPIGRLPGGDS
jgi:hypothetical protein